jgi:hypothetical protein
MGTTHVNGRISNVADESRSIEAMGFEIDPLQHAIRAVRTPLLTLRGRGDLRLAPAQIT